MAFESFPNLDHNNRVITLAEHEQVAAPERLSGLTGWSGQPPVYADATGRHVKLRAGYSASILGTRFNNLSETLIPVAANASGQTRIDLVVLRLRRQDSSLGADDRYTITPVAIEGVPGNQNPPALVRDVVPGSGFWDIPLAAVVVAAGAVTIGSEHVTPKHHYITASGYAGSEAWGFPPAEPGMIFRAENTGATYIGTSSGAWVTVTEDTGWVSPELGSSPSWSVQGTGVARTRLRNGVVHLQLDLFRVGGPLSGAPDWVAAVPWGFQPDREIIMTGAMNAGGHAVRFSVRPDRGVWIDAYPTALVPGRAVSVNDSWPI
ncbi:hypothetical protein AB0J14_04745 [Micromonospora arborensis]|uniref:hypothetical protein n=1 Tax=Micromonospora arborensis TaxID=2116518 RepID=UPI0033D947B0